MAAFEGVRHGRLLLGTAVPDAYATEPGVGLHSYPPAKKLRVAWIAKLRTGKQPSATTRVCSKHFREEYFCFGVGAAMFGE